MPHDLRCRAMNAKGEPCGAPSKLVDAETMLCPSHDPAKAEMLRQAAKKGGQATARRFASDRLKDEELPPLNSPEVAELWLERIGRATATGRLNHHDATATTRAVQQWLKAHEAGRMADRLDALREQLVEIRGRQ